MALAASIEATVNNVRLDYTVPAGGVSLTLARVGPSGIVASVRAWDGADVAPGAIIARDFEAPIGVPLTYTATTLNSGGSVVETASDDITLDSGGCSDTWLTDLARATNTQRIVLQSLDELAYVVPATVHDIITRRAPIVTTDIAHTPELELAFVTETDAAREQAKFTLGNGFPVLLRTPPESGIGNLYLAVLGYAEQRIVTLAEQPARRFVVQARQVERPDPDLYQPVAPVTYAHVGSTFADYATLAAERATYDALAYDWAGASPDDVFPWPPSDV